MTPDDQLYRFRQRTLALAEELGGPGLRCRCRSRTSVCSRWTGRWGGYGSAIGRLAEHAPLRRSCGTPRRCPFARTSVVPRVDGSAARA